MARGDYAQRGGGRNQAKPKGKGGGRGLPGWLWLILGLSFGLAVAAAVYITRPAQPLPGQAARPDPGEDAGAEARPGKTAAAEPKRKEAIKLPPKEKSRFTFYELLPNQEVVVPREDQQAAGKAGADDGLYIIQVASYRTQADADAQKARLALLGVESRIEKVTIDNKDTYFRVRVGPEKSLARAHTIMARLEENGIQGMLVKVK